MAHYVVLAGNFVQEANAAVILDGALQELRQLQSNSVLNGKLQVGDVWKQDQYNDFFPNDDKIARTVADMGLPMPLKVIRTELVQPRQVAKVKEVADRYKFGFGRYEIRTRKALPILYR